MKIAVITPYYKESTAELKRCHDSVKAQTVPCHHIFVSDGHPHPMIDTLDATHIRVPGHADYGDTPRLIGGAHATTAGYDAVLLLDADNWFDPDHVATLLAYQAKTGVDVVTCGRKLVHCETLQPFAECDESDGDTFVDTNCYLLMRSALPYMAGWGFKDPKRGIVGDRIFWNTLKGSSLKRAHSPRNGVNYVSTFATHYLHRGLDVPARGKLIVDYSGGKGLDFRMRPWEEVKHLLPQAK